MEIRKSLHEIENMAAAQTGRRIRISQTAPDTVRLHLLLDIELVLTGHTDTALVFAYHTGALGRFAAHSAEKLFGPIRTKKITLDTAARQISLHLDVFGEFKPYFEGRIIRSAAISDGLLRVELADKAV